MAQRTVLVLIFVFFLHMNKTKSPSSSEFSNEFTKSFPLIFVRARHFDSFIVGVFSSFCGYIYFVTGRPWGDEENERKKSLIFSVLWNVEEKKKYNMIEWNINFYLKITFFLFTMKNYKHFFLSEIAQREICHVVGRSVVVNCRDSLCSFWYLIRSETWMNWARDPCWKIN